MGGMGAAAKTLGGGALKSLPVLGNVLSGGSALYNMAKGNWGSAALDAAGMIPGYGNAIQFGRMGYELGKGMGGQPQQQQPQPPSPQGLPNYGKMASLRIVDDQSTRGLAFESGVERFCKEASFDDEDKAALYRVMIKAAEDEIPTDTGLANFNEGLGNTNSWLKPMGDPRLGTMTNLWNYFSEGMFGQNGGIRKLIDAPMQSFYEHQDRVKNDIETDKLFKTNPTAWHQKMDQKRLSGDKGTQQFDLDKAKAFEKAKDLQARFPNANPRQIASMTFSGMGPASTLMRQEFLAQAEGRGPSAPATPAGAPNTMPGVSQPPAPNSSTPTPTMSPTPARTAPPSGGGGYMSGSPPAASGGAGGMSSMSGPGANPMGPPTPNQGPAATKPNFAGNATSSMGSTPGANPMVAPKGGGSISAPKTPKV